MLGLAMKGNHTNAHHAEIFAKWKEISSLKLSGILNLPNNGDTQLVEAEFHYNWLSLPGEECWYSWKN